MTSCASGHRRPSLDEVLREPTTPAALLDAVRDRMIGARQRENRAPASTAALIRERLPELAARTVADAGRALAGLLVLPGTGAQPYFVGNPPDWFANPVNDNEYRWILNRHGHWRNLLAAYSLTGERQYGEKVVQEVRDWIARVPRPPLSLDPAVARPSRRLCLEDAAPVNGTARLYAAVIVPYRATSPVPDVSNLHLDRDGEQIRCSFALMGQPYAFSWSETGLSRR